MDVSETEAKWAAWDGFLEENPQAGFMQSSWWADFRVGAGYDHFAVILKSNGRILGGAVVMKYSISERQAFYYIPEGPLLPVDKTLSREVFESIMTEVKTRRQNEPQLISHLRMEPRWPALPGFIRGFQSVTPFRDRFMEPRDTLYVDLRPSEESILAQMKPKGRYNIRVAQRHGVSIEEDPSAAGLEQFLRLYDETASRQGLSAKPPEYFEELIAILTRAKHGTVFFAKHDDQYLAAALVVFFGNRATYFFGASTQNDRHLMAPYLLHFEIMMKAKAMGFAWYDFWGIAPAGNLGHPWNAITLFKKKFGGSEVQFVPTMDYVFDAAAYHEYAALEGNVELIEETSLF